MSTRRVTSSSGFTIIEVLVVVSIIALLIAMLLPSLAESRKRAQYIRWKAYSHSLRVDPDVSVYFNMEDQYGDELNRDNEPIIYNKAAGDPFVQAKGARTRNGATASEERNLVLRSMGAPPKLPEYSTSRGRWKGKGSLYFPGQFATSGNRGYGTIDDYYGVLGADERNVAVWLRPRKIATPAEQNWYALTVWGRLSGDDRFYFGLNKGNGVVMVNSGSGQVNTVTGDVRDDKWHFAACRLQKPYTGPNELPTLDNMDIYLDGSKRSKPANAATINTEPRPFFVGCDETISDFMHGEIDEAIVWKTPVSEERLLEMYKIGTPPDFEPMP